MTRESNGGIPANLSPIFVMGCPRSGTTLISQILNTHSRIAIYHETNYYLLLRPELPYYGDLNKPSNLRRLVADGMEIVGTQGVKPPDLEEFLEALVAPTFEGVLATLLYLHARQEGKVRGGEKTPQHFLYLPEIQEKFPESPVVFLIRDPRDAVLSMRNSFRQTLEGAAQEWNEAFLSCSRASRPVYKVRYEDFVDQPEQSTQALCRFLGEAYEPTMLRFSEQLPTLLRNLPAPLRGWLSGPVVTTSVGTFREMPRRDIELVEAICAEGMAAMRYSFTTLRRAAAPVARKKPSFLRFMINRIRYYGFNRNRWRRGWARWKIVARVRTRYLLTLGPLRSLSLP